MFNDLFSDEDFGIDEKVKKDDKDILDCCPSTGSNQKKNGIWTAKGVWTDDSKKVWSSKDGWSS